jgi:hypothetical protein
MNKVEQLTNLGGFPMTQYTLDFMQQSYRDALGALAKLVGDAVIVSGMEDTGSNVANGWISFNGELIPFTGGPKQSTWIIEDVTEDRLFADQVNRTVYFTRRARFAAGGTNYSNLQRIETLLGLKGVIASLDNRLTQQVEKIWKRGDIIEVDCSTAYIQTNFDGSGLGRSERAGWAICNGNNGTRNRAGRFPLGYDPNRSEYNTVGNTGGQETVSLSVGQIPAHMHTGARQVSARGWPDDSGDRTDNYYYIHSSRDSSQFYQTFDTNYTGSGQSHENRPPYIVTLWIMKL